PDLNLIHYKTAQTGLTKIQIPIQRRNPSYINEVAQKCRIKRRLNPSYSR
ncbi:hypothetical protein HMPREF3156_01874, partial [Neisseria sp. HMSC06F02]